MGCQDYVPMLFFFYNQSLLPQEYLFIGFLFWVDFFTGNIISRTFPDFVKFRDISRTSKMNLLLSRFSRRHGNPFSLLQILLACLIYQITVLMDEDRPNLSITCCPVGNSREEILLPLHRSLWLISSTIAFSFWTFTARRAVLVEIPISTSAAGRWLSVFLMSTVRRSFSTQNFCF